MAWQKLLIDMRMHAASDCVWLDGMPCNSDWMPLIHYHNGTLLRVDSASHVSSPEDFRVFTYMYIHACAW